MEQISQAVLEKLQSAKVKLWELSGPPFNKEARDAYELLTKYIELLQNVQKQVADYGPYHLWNPREIVGVPIGMSQPAVFFGIVYTNIDDDNGRYVIAEVIPGFGFKIAEAIELVRNWDKVYSDIVAFNPTTVNVKPPPLTPH